MLERVFQSTIAAGLMLTLVSLTIGFANAQRYEFKVTNATAAIRIAKAVLRQELGKQDFDRLTLYEAKRQGDHWIVSSSPYQQGKIPPTGGGFDVVIAVAGGCVLDLRAEI